MNEEEIKQLFEPRSLINIGLQSYPSSSFLIRTFFPKMVENDTEYVDIVLKKGSKKLAPFVSPKVAGKVVDSAKRTVVTYKPAYIKLKHVTKATDILSQTNTPIYANDETATDRVAQLLVEEITEDTIAIDRRIEWMASQVLQTGKCPIVGDEINEVIDCLFDASQIKTLEGAERWSEDGSSPIKTLRTLRKERTDAGGKAPDTVAMGVELYETYINHNETKEMFKESRIFRGNLAPTLQVEGVIYIGYIPELATHIYVYDESFVNDEGKNEYLVNTKGFIYGSTKAEGVVAFGAIKDFKALYATKIFIKSWEEEDPSVRYLLTQSAPVVIPTLKDSFAFCKAI